LTRDLLKEEIDCPALDLAKTGWLEASIGTTHIDKEKENGITEVQEVGNY
jgi:hypothetical protein